MQEKRHKAADIALIVIAVLAVLYTLRLARDVMLPITLALIFALLLSPVVSRLQRWRVPRSLGALLIVATGVGLLGGSLYGLSSPAAKWLGRAPEAIAVMREQLRSVDSDSPEVDAATRSIDNIASEFSTASEGSAITRVVVTEPGWRSEVWELIRNFGVYGTLSVILLFFLLSAGDQLLRRFIHILPRERDKANVIALAAKARKQMSRYLLTITAMNLVIGIITALALWSMDFPDPLLWGAVAALLRYIPYLGVSITVILLGIVSAVSYSEPLMIIAAPLGFAALTAGSGQFIDPLIHGMRFSLNPIVVFLWIFFWGWLWGAPGVLLAVPLLTLFQVICQHSERLVPLAHIIGSDYGQDPANSPAALPPGSLAPAADHPDR